MKGISLQKYIQKHSWAATPKIARYCPKSIIMLPKSKKTKSEQAKNYTNENIQST